MDELCALQFLILYMWSNYVALGIRKSESLHFLKHSSKSDVNIIRDDTYVTSVFMLFQST